MFSRKINKQVHSNLTFNNSHVNQTESQKHLGLILDNKLNFREHLKGVLDKISKPIGLIHNFQPILPRFSTQILLFGDEKLSITASKSILEVTIQFLISSGRFDSPLLDILSY